MLLSRFLLSLNAVLSHAVGTTISSMQMMSEKNEYNACTFMLGDKRVIYREAKVTPKKIGLFVAIWKRNDTRVTVPYHVDDEFGYMMIAVKTDTEIGYFLYSKEVLGNLGIISTDVKEGKCGMRIYPTLEEGMNKQALKTYYSQLSSYHNLLSASV